MSHVATWGNRLIQPVTSVVEYLRDSVSELQKVTWPTREQTIQYTTIVVVSVLVVIGITSALDYGLTKLVEQLITWSQRV